MKHIENLSDLIHYLMYKAGKKKYCIIDWQHGFINNFLPELKNQPPKKEDYERLVANLDKKSVETIDRIIERIHTASSTNLAKVDFFDAEEKLCLYKLKYDFYKKIKKRPDGTYSYKNYILPIKWFEANVFFYNCGLDSFNDICDLKKRSIIDVGGFIGDSALVFRKYSNAPIYVFEPGEDNFKLLQQTIKLNNLKNVVIEKCALGDVEKKVAFSENLSGSKVANDGYLVEQITLDDYVEKHNIDVGLIKVDIEGYEKNMLLGAKNTILKHRPKMLISMYHNYEQFFGLKPMIEEWGYKCKVVKPTDGSIFAETTLVCEPV